MSSTNKTTNYNLSQFVGTDVPSYLGDYNSDMSKIDKAIGDVANSQGSVEQSVVGLTADVQGLSTNVDGMATSVQQLQTSVAQIDSAYKQADTALSQRITANANNIQTNTTAIENINTTIGTEDISGIGSGTIKGAIKNIDNNLNNSCSIKFIGNVNIGAGESYTIEDTDYDELMLVIGYSNSNDNYLNASIKKGSRAAVNLVTQFGDDGIALYSKVFTLSEDGRTLTSPTSQETRTVSGTTTAKVTVNKNDSDIAHLKFTFVREIYAIKRN